MDDIAIERASPSDKEAIEDLLQQAKLPSSDIADHLTHFFVARKARKVIGAVGLEIAGNAALIRSLVVGESLRGKGLGRKLYEAIVNHARESGTKELGLLTTTAERFFAKSGFQKVEGKNIPEFVKNTKEYRTLCPSSAVCMVKRIQDS